MVVTTIIVRVLSSTAIILSQYLDGGEASMRMELAYSLVITTTS